MAQRTDVANVTHCALPTDAPILRGPCTIGRSAKTGRRNDSSSDKSWPAFFFKGIYDPGGDGPPAVGDTRTIKVVRRAAFVAIPIQRRFTYLAQFHRFRHWLTAKLARIVMAHAAPGPMDRSSVENVTPSRSSCKNSRAQVSMRIRFSSGIRRISA